MRNRIYAWSIGSATRKFQLPILLLFYSILIWRMDHHLDRFIPFEQLRVSKNLSKYLREKQKRVRENLLDLFSKCFQVYIMTNLEETYSTSPSCTPWWLSCCRSWRIDQEQSVGRSKARDVLRLYKTNESRGEWNNTNILRRSKIRWTRSSRVCQNSEKERQHVLFVLVHLMRQQTTLWRRKQIRLILVLWIDWFSVL